MHTQGWPRRTVRGRSEVTEAEFTRRFVRAMAELIDRECRLMILRGKKHRKLQLNRWRRYARDRWKREA